VSGAALAAVALLAVAPPSVPAGFQATVYASGLHQPTALSFGPHGFLYATEEAGRVVSFSQGAKAPRVFATGFRESTLGLLWYAGALYVSDKGRVTRLTDPTGDRRSDTRRVILDHLPNGLHQQDALVQLHGRLYLGEGSTCNACPQRSRLSAAVLSFRPDGSDVRVFASGLRNPYGLAVDGRGRIWATDNGRDEQKLGAPDELDLLQPGHRYGFPTCYGVRQGTGCAGTDTPVALFAAHTSADGFAFAPARFSPKMAGDAFVALWGTYYGHAAGRYLARVHLRDGTHRVERFASGLDHPLAVTFAKDGAMLVADWGSGIVWRIARR
jgi:glucose/arabinose dehydrogenase